MVKKCQFPWIPKACFFRIKNTPIYQENSDPTFNLRAPMPTMCHCLLRFIHHYVNLWILTLQSGKNTWIYIILGFWPGNLPKLIHKDIYCCNCCTILYPLHRMSFLPSPRAKPSAEWSKVKHLTKSENLWLKIRDPPKKKVLNRSKWPEVETFLGASAYQVHSRRCIQRVQWACCSQSQIKTSFQKYRTLTEVLARLRIWSEKNENSQKQKGAAAFGRLTKSKRRGTSFKTRFQKHVLPKKS